MKIFIIIILCGYIASNALPIPRKSRQATTPDPRERMEVDEESDEESDEPRDLLEDDSDDEKIQKKVANDLFDGPMSRQGIKETLKRALALMEKPKLPQRERRRGPNFDQVAKNLVRFMSQDPTMGSTSEDSEHRSPTKRVDHDYCDAPDDPTSGDSSFSLSTMTRIVRLAENGLSEKSIRGQYPRYRRQYLAYFKRCVEAGGSDASKKKDINLHVLAKFNEARSLKRPVHQYMLRRWAIERAADHRNA